MGRPKHVLCITSTLLPVWSVANRKLSHSAAMTAGQLVYKAVRDVSISVLCSLLGWTLIDLLPLMSAMCVSSGLTITHRSTCRPLERRIVTLLSVRYRPSSFPSSVCMCTRQPIFLLYLFLFWMVTCNQLCTGKL